MLFVDKQRRYAYSSIANEANFRFPPPRRAIQIIHGHTRCREVDMYLYVCAEYVRAALLELYHW